MGEIKNCFGNRVGKYEICIIGLGGNGRLWFGRTIKSPHIDDPSPLELEAEHSVTIRDVPGSIFYRVPSTGY